jgi:hypothetical protein
MAAPSVSTRPLSVAPVEVVEAVDSVVAEVVEGEFNPHVLLFRS